MLANSAEMFLPGIGYPTGSREDPNTPFASLLERQFILFQNDFIQDIGAVLEQGRPARAVYRR